MATQAELATQESLTADKFKEKLLAIQGELGKLKIWMADETTKKFIAFFRIEQVQFQNRLESGNCQNQADYKAICRVLKFFKIMEEFIRQNQTAEETVSMQ